MTSSGQMKGLVVGPNEIRWLHFKGLAGFRKMGAGPDWLMGSAKFTNISATHVKAVFVFQGKRNDFMSESGYLNTRFPDTMGLSSRGLNYLSNARK